MELDKRDSFSEWYSKVLLDAGVVDIRYPVKGMPVYMPWGFGMMDCMFRILESMLNNSGHKKLLFPVAIPQSVFAKESRHIKGFEGEVLWVTHGGKNKLEENLILRPTSETSMYPMFALWIRSHSDLPLKVYQTTAVYRHETKATKPLIRGREIYWNEGHAVHKTYDDAANNVEDILGLYAAFFNHTICISFKIIKRPKHDTFPGADYTYAFDTVMPDGRILQIATVHNLAENFSRPYNIKYCDENGKTIYASQTTYGISMRALAALISVHGDDRGLAIPFEIAPVQIVFVPIYSKGAKEKVDEQLREAYNLLKNKYRCHYDDSDKRPGDKFYHWEMKGVPLRVEAGMRDLARNKLTIVDRLGNKKLVDMNEAAAEIVNIKSKYNTALLNRAADLSNSYQSEANSINDLIKIMKSKKGFVKVGWCGGMNCVEALKVHAIDILGHEKGANAKRKCIICGNDGERVLVGKPY